MIKEKLTDVIIGLLFINAIIVLIGFIMGLTLYSYHWFNREKILKNSRDKHHNKGS